MSTFCPFSFCILILGGTRNEGKEAREGLEEQFRSVSFDGVRDVIMVGGMNMWTVVETACVLECGRGDNRPRVEGGVPDFQYSK